MKHLIFFCILAFTTGACDNASRFGGVGEPPPAETSGDFLDTVPSIVREDSKPKVGRKKTASKDVQDTVRQRDLDGKQEVTNVTVTDVFQDKKASPDESQTTKQPVKIKVVEKVIVKEVVRAPKKAPALKKLDLLFYMEERDTDCIQNIRSYSEKNGFLRHLNKFDWQVSFAYHSHSDVAFLPLEWDNGKAYNKAKRWYKFKTAHVLSKKNHKPKEANQIFNATLKDYWGGGEYDTTSHDEPKYTYKPGMNTNPKMFWDVENPLVGLSAILSKKSKGAVRAGSQVVALWFGSSFAIYSEKSWGSFFRKHKNADIISVGWRTSNATEFLYNSRNNKLHFIASCHDPTQIIKAIQSKVR